MERTFIVGLPNNIVQDHIMPKLIEPILAIKPCAIDVIEKDDAILYFMVLLCKFVGVNKI